ncbi:hypothetical protein PAXRUDRAFT_613134 [Paxillus rubicundulus Ve08.2h10]|uniref:Uncharacterized protein n=1 Tax=Paxillus rubicundulus Ve08.2h10 TaxID=930991 RepID=A0A0D0D556_9AGAM|nr:hypothetical protein PAXRUDRAFT_613134 [Paxillus rubicundulus Ve08.2h10]
MVSLALRTTLVTVAMSTDATPGNTTSAETATGLFNDRINLIAATTVISAVYGILASLYVATTYFLLKKLFRSNSRCSSNPHSDPRPRNERRQALVHLIYTLVLFVLATMYTAGNSQNAVVAYVDNRLFPGGPTQYYEEYMTGQSAMVMTDIASFMILWLTDALILWRFIVFYYKLRYARWIIPLPCAMYVGVVVLSVLVLQGEAGLGKIYYLSENLLLSYYGLSLSLSVLTTFLIAVRLYIHKRDLERMFGPNVESPYMSLATILVESAALYGVWSLLFLILSVKGSPVQTIILATMSEIQVIAPLLIILWIARGTAWGSGSGIATPDQPPHGGRLSFGSRPMRVTDAFGFGDVDVAATSRPRGIAAGSEVTVIELGLRGSAPSSFVEVEDGEK